MTRIFWLSFCDGDLPEGEQFLGACIVEISEDEAAKALPVIDRMFPNHTDEGGWIGAASRKALRLGCNPGGQMLSLDITDADPELVHAFPVNTLLNKADIEARGPIVRPTDDDVEFV